MRVRDWEDIVKDVVEADAEPADWRAVAGQRSGGVGEDLYLAHPNRGMFFLKTYAKNPFERKGVGTRVARSVDDEIGSYLPEERDSMFAVRPGPDENVEKRARQVEETVKAHADAPTTPSDLFEDMMRAMDSPAFGPLEFDPQGRPSPLDDLSGTFDEAESVLSAELEDLIERDQIDHGFD